MEPLRKTDVLKGFLGKIRAVWIMKGLKISILNGLKNNIP